MAYSSSGTKLVTWSQDQAETVALSYILGLGGKLDLSKKICLLINADFYAANADWGNVREISFGHITGKTEIDYYYQYQNYRTINLSAGLGFRF